jgi:hypothetical protein
VSLSSSPHSFLDFLLHLSLPPFSERAWNPTQKREQDVDEEGCADPVDEEDGQRREEDGADDLDECSQDASHLGRQGEADRDEKEVEPGERKLREGNKVREKIKKKIFLIFFRSSAAAALVVQPYKFN